MTMVLGATSTTDDVLLGIDLHGKRVLVTGASAGIGVETARALARGRIDPTSHNGARCARLWQAVDTAIAVIRATSADPTGILRAVG